MGLIGEIAINTLVETFEELTEWQKVHLNQIKADDEAYKRTTLFKLRELYLESLELKIEIIKAVFKI